MIIGFTGTKEGMTQRQKDSLRQLFCWFSDLSNFDLKLRHGDCVGADSEAQDIFLFNYRWSREALIHPPLHTRYRAFCKGVESTPPLPYLKRNRYIAGCVAGFRTDLLIACPKEGTEQLRSGTWATVRYARDCGTPRIILLP